MFRRAFRALKHVGHAARVGREVQQVPSIYPYTSDVALAGVEFRFRVKDETAAQWYSPSGHAALLENRLLAELVRPGMRILDIGCHHGFYLAFLAKLTGPGGFVLGVDVHPDNVEAARAQVALNGIGGWCEVLHRAVSARDRGHLWHTDCSNASVVHSGGGGLKESSCVTVDRLCSTYGDFDLLMVDTEGYEEEVLKGAAGLLDRRRPSLAVEIHLDCMPMFGSTKASLARAGRFSDYAGCMVVRVDPDTRRAFDLDGLPEQGIVNAFLRLPAGGRGN